MNLYHPRHWPSWIGVGMLRQLARVPYPLACRLGRRLGRLLRRVARSRERIARRNLELCFPELDDGAREILLARHFELLGISLFEVAQAWWAPRERLESLVEISGLEHLQKASENGKGVLLLSAHFTSLEISGRLLSLHAPFDAMYRQSMNPVIEWAMARGRRSFCDDIIPRDAVKQMLRRVRGGHTVWYAPDQNTQRKKAVFPTFFGHTASTTPATHKLARMTGAAVVPFMAVRKDDDSGYRLVIEPPLQGFPGNDALTDTQRINDIIERWVRAYPEQYLWIHRRFRTRPTPEEPRLY
ncbi:MAG: LpxL/LpxP family Kdo(2)-lipid IV(A) lauroyl/palmitoleoyl acyltransferase [Gammaproteobacteria bacterium]|nr:LpxL/LpxP family Kdo(2)-lipid IV(A) lauroyl/palmitoleoyl acyltransferase [Gammaproteobacteria bacterium]